MKLHAARHRAPIRPFAAIAAIALLAVLAGCAGSTSTVRVPSENYNSRVSIVVIHFTAIDFDASLRILTESSSRPVSSHYLIPEPNDASYDKARLKVYELVDEQRRAWHAGVSHWRGKTGLNDQSIGIELVNVPTCHRIADAEEPAAGMPAAGSEVTLEPDEPEEVCFFPDFAESQIVLLTELLGDIVERHPDIRPTHIVAHSDIAPDRKIDPGPRFPWERLYELGFGAWFDEDTAVRYWRQFLDEPLPLENVQAALNTWGYGIEVTGTLDRQTRDVLRAFQMHFRPHEVTHEATPITVAILFALIEKYYPDELAPLLVVEPEPAEDPAEAPEEERIEEPLEETSEETSEEFVDEPAGTGE